MGVPTIAQKIYSLDGVSTGANEASIAEPQEICDGRRRLLVERGEFIALHLPRLTKVVGGSSITMMDKGISIVLAAHKAE
jgi:hypothetical protein